MQVKLDNLAIVLVLHQGRNTLEMEICKETIKHFGQVALRKEVILFPRLERKRVHHREQSLLLNRMIPSSFSLTN